MSAIKSALIKMNTAIDRLDGAVGGIEETLAGQQRDMFVSNNANQNGGAATNGHAVDSAVLAQKLDSAIGKVEEILKESA